MPGGARGGNKSEKSEEENQNRLINKVCTSFLAKLEEKLDSGLNKLDAKLSEVCNSLKNISSSVAINTKDIDVLKNQCDSLEQHGKRNSLRIVGLDESEDENIAELVSLFIMDKLGIPISVSDIDFAFRLGKNTDEANKRMVLVNFTTNNKRNQVYMAKNKLKDSVFAIYEDLTQLRYNLLTCAKKKYGRRNAWSSGGKVYFWNARANKKVLVNSKNDL